MQCGFAKAGLLTHFVLEDIGGRKMRTGIAGLVDTTTRSHANSKAARNVLVLIEQPNERTKWT